MCVIAAVKLKDPSKADQIPVLELVMRMLYQCNHRGQDGCGFAWPYNDKLELHKDKGLVENVYNKLIEKYESRKKIHRLITHQAIGHGRYATEGSAEWDNLQPAIAESERGRVFAIANNGNLINYDTERKQMEGERFRFDSTNEAELMLRKILIHHKDEMINEKSDEVDFIKSIRYAVQYFKGAFASILMTRNNLFAFLDPQGFRPLVIGETEDFYALASESCALDILRVPVESRFELKPGQIIHINNDGIVKHQTFPTIEKHCIFEFIYYARPDSIQWIQEPVYIYRERLGKELAKLDPEINKDNVDLVMPVPDSSNSIAYGYAEEKGIRYIHDALIRNHFAGRTFIKNGQTNREDSVRIKFNPKPWLFKGKRVVVIDDSIVRGTTVRRIISMLFQSGAKEVYFRSGSPPVKGPCYYGIATQNSIELAWNKYRGLNGIIENIKNHPEIAKYLKSGCKFSLKYHELHKLYSSVLEKEKFCFACFDGNYPVK